MPGFPNQPIAFEKVGEDLATGRVKWKLVDEYGNEHVHKGGTQPLLLLLGVSEL